jgi:hypothetical protein
VGCDGWTSLKNCVVSLIVLMCLKKYLQIKIKISKFLCMEEKLYLDFVPNVYKSVVRKH